MKLIIISVFYNREKEVDSSVKSLINAAPNKSKIVLINDGSKDKTFKKLNSFKEDTRVEVIDQQNIGFSETLSSVIPTLLQKEDYEYLSIHGSGDLCEEDKFIKQINYLDRNKDVVALGCGHKTFSGQNRKVLRVDDGFLEASKNSLYEGVPFTHGTVVYRTKPFMEAGGYNKLFKFCQDWELYFRLLDYGKIIRHPEALYSKYIFNDGASFKPIKRIEQIKYKKLIQSRKVSDAFFNEQVALLKKSNINSMYADADYINEFKRTQKSLIIKGELRLAKEWSNLIYEKTSDKKYHLMTLILNLLDFLKFPSALLSRFYNINTKVKKVF